MALIKNNWFVVVLFILPLFAWPFPELGAADGYLQAQILSKIAVMLIFLMNGITLNSEAMISAVKKVRVLLAIQGFCFIAAPLIAYLLIKTVFQSLEYREEFITGIYILSCLPTTIASCAVFTKMAGGDAIVSLFNAVLSNCMGVFLAPYLLDLLLGANGLKLDFSPTLVIYELLYLIVIPLILGQVIHARWGGLLKEKWQINPHFSFIGQCLLLFIVYSAFCNTFMEARSELLTLNQVLLLLVGMALLQFIYMAGSYLLGWVFYPREKVEQIAIFFTASQKTIAVGIPLSMAFIEATGITGLGVGFTLLPLLLFNNVQWLVSGTLASLFKGYTR